LNLIDLIQIFISFLKNQNSFGKDTPSGKNYWIVRNSVININLKKTILQFFRLYLHLLIKVGKIMGPRRLHVLGKKQG
jgi:hypothetical protein